MVDISDSKWYETDDSNTSAAPNGITNSSFPSAVDDIIRMHQGAIKRWYDLIQPINASTGSANAYVLTQTVAPSAYVTGAIYAFRANFANTGACTVNVNSLGAKSIKLTDGSDPASGDIANGMPVYLTYDGTNMVLSNPVYQSTTPLSKGGTGATTASAARTALGLAIGTDIEAYDSTIVKTGANQTFTKAQRTTITTLTDGATITPDFSASNDYTVTLGGNRTLANGTNITAGQGGVIYVIQDATGSRTLSFGSYYKFEDGTAPTLSTAANAIDVIAYEVKSSTEILCKWLGNFS